MAKNLARPRLTRRRNPDPAKPISFPQSESCEACALAHRRIRLTLSIPEAKLVADTLATSLHVNSDEAFQLKTLIEAHLTLAQRSESYQYD